MGVIFAGTSLADFDTINAVKETTSGRWGPYVKEGIKQSGYPFLMRLPSTFTPISEGWVSAYVWSDQWGPGGNVILIYNMLFSLCSGSWTNKYWTLDWDGGSDVCLEMWNGTSYDELVHATSPFADSARHRVDIHLKIHGSAGVFEVFVDGTVIWSYFGNTISNGATTFDRVSFENVNTSSNSNICFSAVIVSTTDTRSLSFQQLDGTAAGFNTSWTGTYTDIVKTGIDDANAIQSDTANQIETYVTEDINPIFNYYAPVAVIVSTRARRGSSGPQNLQIAVRHSGTDGATADIGTLSSSYGNVQASMLLNPVTGLPWTVTDINNAEFGVKSVT